MTEPRERDSDRSYDPSLSTNSSLTPPVTPAQDPAYPGPQPAAPVGSTASTLEEEHWARNPAADSADDAGLDGETG